MKTTSHNMFPVGELLNLVEGVRLELSVSVQEEEPASVGHRRARIQLLSPSELCVHDTGHWSGDGDGGIGAATVGNNDLGSASDAVKGTSDAMALIERWDDD